VGAAILKARAPHTVCDLGTCKTCFDDERNFTEFITRLVRKQLKLSGEDE